MTTPTVFPATRSADWYRTHLFAQQAKPTVWNAEKARIRTLDWKPPKKIHVTACMLCSVRPIERISNWTRLRKLGLNLVADAMNGELAHAVGRVP